MNKITFFIVICLMISILITGCTQPKDTVGKIYADDPCISVFETDESEVLVSGIRYDIDDCPETGVIHLVSPVDSPGNSGVFVEFFSKEAGTKTLTFSINNPDPIGNGNHRLFVQNNDNEGENIILTHDAEVGDWVYREYTCTINVKAGKNTLTLYNNNAETRTDCRINIAYIDFSETTLDENES